MRNFLISFICIIFLLSSWICFSIFSSAKTSECVYYADKLVHNSIISEDWDTARQDFDALSNTWNQYQKIAYFFIDAKEINEINGVMEKSQLYLEAEDISNSNGEISYLREKIKNLHQGDTLLLKNIM